ncbi:MAG: hypothetical protein A2511_16770 [Deltaproteobacteria bacterium RIFOXYD12_FULL_50_9]|nr:MAG: hypothetical protein A2511_16770 [Deltaproteobacteria bacterium RIFOXYD12_FULL_50_9]
MKRIFFTLGIITVVFCTSAFAGIKPCEELKAEIDAKLKEKGVNSYTLEILPADQVKEQKIIGSCEGGSKKISFTRN